MAIKFDESEIRKTIATLKPNNQLFEIRIVDGKWNASGYFTDAETLIHKLKTTRLRESANVYITLNNISPECYDRTQKDKFVEYAKETTADGNIQGIEWLMIDLDPKRASGTAASNEQVAQAQHKANAIYKYLKGRGWTEPIAAMSGNGVHLLYNIKLANKKERVELLKKCLLTLNMLFTDDEVDIDLKTYNASRICKLYGTISHKGANTPDRPHRNSYIVSAPTQIINNDIKQLESLVELLPKEEPPQKYNQYNPTTFNVEEWIVRHGLKVSEKAEWNGGTKWILEECPFDNSHKGKDASVIQTADGKICFNCFHNSCAGNHWRELRLLYEPDAYDRQYVKNTYNPNYKNENYVVETRKETKLIDGKPVFYTTEEIRLMKVPPEEFIPSGIHVIDKKLRGLKKGFVTCLSGLRACGKSSIISQITIEAANAGYRTALFSGELTAVSTLNWLLLQSAGRDNVQSTQYENYYVVNEDKKVLISQWLNDKVYIYNNEYGNRFDDLLSNLKKCVIDHKVDLVILDNLMSINTSMLERDKYQQQSVFVEMLEDFAKVANIHILFVAHPRKSNGFLRLDDVSGSNDIVNRVDNAFILHRVNNDFKRLTKQDMGWKDNNELYDATNVMEICKDRNGGVQDEFIPLYFERETKRLKNNEYEYKTYGWEWETVNDITSLPF